MDALTEALVRVLKRLDRLEARLDRLESPAQTPREEPEAQERVDDSPALAAVDPVSPLPAVREAPKLETRIGLTLVNRVGAITLILGVAFFFRYAVESEWLGDTARVLLGLAAGFAALFFADRVWRGGARIFSQGISASGLAILYLSVFAAQQLYGLIPLWPGFAAMVLVTGLGAGLAWRYDSQAIAALSLVGGFATPLLLHADDPQPWFHLGLALLLAAAALWMAHRRGWRALEPLAFVGALALYGFAIRFQPHVRLPGTIFAFAIFVLFAPLRPAPASWRFSLTRFHIPNVGHAAHLLAFLLIAGLWAHDVFARGALTLLLVAAALGIAVWRGRSTNVVAALVSFWVAYFAWGWLATHTAASIFAFLTLAFLMFFSWPALMARLERVPLDAPGLLALALNGPLYFAACFSLLASGYPAWRGALAVALSLIHMALAAVLRHRDLRAATLSAVVAWAFLTLAIPIQFAGYRATMVWGLEAAALVWTGVRAGHRRLAWAGLFVFGLAIARLLWIDAWMYPGAAAYGVLANARFLTFLVVALSLWAGSLWLGRAMEGLVAYLAGHFVLLWGLGLEVAGWAARNASLLDVASVRSTALSILAAAYAMVLVGLGVWRRSGLNRGLGLGLIAAVVVKLYVYDVWLLARLYRVAAFAGLGVLLLATSYLYSRYRAAQLAATQPGPTPGTDSRL
jgi:Predicted membrane protein (DUF2339)